MTSEKEIRSTEDKRKAYRSPELVPQGNVAQVTRKTGAYIDQGAPFKQNP